MEPSDDIPPLRRGEGPPMERRASDLLHMRDGIVLAGGRFRLRFISFLR